MKTKALLVPHIAKLSLVAGMTAIAFTTLVMFAHADVETRTRVDARIATATTTLGSISGTVYNDLDGDEKLDGGEPGIQGFVIKLHTRVNWSERNKKGLFATTTTDANGNYSFGNLANGTYNVEEIRKAGWKQTSGDFKKLKIKNGVSLSGNNFANVAIASSTNQGGHDDDDNDDDHDNKGKHLGWSNFFSHFGNLPWGIGKNKDR